MKSIHDLLTRDKVKNMLVIRYFHTANEVKSFKFRSLSTWTPLDFYTRIRQNKIYAGYEVSRTVMLEYTEPILLLWRNRRMWKR